MDSPIRDAILDELGGLNDAQLRQVLSSLRESKDRATSRGTVQDLLREFGGSIPSDELDRIERAVEEDCERIEPD